MADSPAICVDAEPLTDVQQMWVASAWDEVNEEQLRALVTDMVSIPSPTGEEAVLATYVVERMRAAGIGSRYQPLDDMQANAVGRVPGGGGGADLLLYAPLDTLTTGSADEDCPGIGDVLRPDMLPEARQHGPRVVGLGAGNPKGHAACVIAAIEAVQRARIPLLGDVIAGLGAGGMPTNRRPVDRLRRYNAGQGSGCSFMLEQGVQADFAVIAKPGWSVAWEEVGLCWFRVRVHGAVGYVGSRHRLSYRHAIVDAARVIARLEEWFREYAASHASGLVEPQAQIGAVESGWIRMPSFSSAGCDLWIDVRTTPRTTPMNVKREFADAIGRIRQSDPDIEVSWDMVLSIPGTHTPPSAWIVQSCVRAWQALEGRPHEVQNRTSGATDANILRGRGLPTARVGMPKLRDEGGREVDFSLGMNAVDVRDMVKLTRLLIWTIVDTCGRRREELDVPYGESAQLYGGEERVMSK